MPATVGEWLQAAAGAAALWWLLAGCAAPQAQTLVRVYCEGRVQNLTVEQYRAKPQCQQVRRAPRLPAALDPRQQA